MMAAPTASRHRSWGGPARTAIIALIIVAVLFLFVFPTRSFLSQRADVNDAREDVEVMREQNARLEDEANRLKTQEEIERLAREQFHYVYPGERAYSVIPAPTSTTVP
jgi:cell division protein FtsB